MGFLLGHSAWQIDQFPTCWPMNGLSVHWSRGWGVSLFSERLVVYIHMYFTCWKIKVLKKYVFALHVIYMTSRTKWHLVDLPVIVQQFLNPQEMSESYKKHLSYFQIHFMIDSKSIIANTLRCVPVNLIDAWWDLIDGKTPLDHVMAWSRLNIKMSNSTWLITKILKWELIFDNHKVSVHVLTCMLHGHQRIYMYSTFNICYIFSHCKHFLTRK